VALKETSLTSAARLARNASENRVLADRWHSLAQQAVEEDRYADAQRHMQLAIAAARKANDKPLQAQLAGLAEDVDGMAAALDRVASAKQVLASNPNDAKAAGQWGRFLCAYKDDWTGGLPLWAAGSDEGLVLLARRDLQNPATSAEQL
jgi:hypothetical protein